MANFPISDAIKEVQALKNQNEKSTALEEMVQNLSEQKISFVTEIEKFKQENSKLKQSLETSEIAQEKHERQLKRVNDENNELLEQVDSLDQALQSAKNELMKITDIQKEKEDFETQVN